MSSCGGRMTDILSRLSMRLEELKLKVDVSKGWQENFKDIEAKMKDLQNQLWRGNESQVMEQLDIAARALDEINTDPKTAISSKRMDQLLEAITMASCGGLIAYTLSRLSTRLDELKLQVQSKGLQDKFKDVEAKMKDLQSQLWQGKERQIMEQLDIAARILDEIIDTDPKTAIRSQLMDQLKEAITKAAGPDKQDTPSASTPTPTDQWEEPDDGVTVVEQKLQKSPAWAHLKLVVDSLDPLLKDCLFTLTVFSANVDIQKRLLLHWWMGEGFVRCIEAGKLCFDQLVEKGLVVPVGKRHCGKHHYCQVQSWLRPLLVAVSNANGFLDYDEAGKPADDYSFSRRLCLRPRQGRIASPKDGTADSRLMTVYNVGNLQPNFPTDWLLNKKELTTLQLGRWRKDDKERPLLAFFDKEFLWGLGKCGALRYLSLRGVSRLERLPHHSVEKLRKLLVLDLRSCHNLEKLPPNLGDARRLQFLDVSDCTLLDQMPKTLASLSELEVLKGFVVCDYWNRNCCQIGDLLKLTKLRKLSITTSREFNDREVVKLRELINGLTSLAITWGVFSKEENTRKMKSVKENPPAGDKKLKPTSPSKLEKLELGCFNEKRLPKWIVPDELSNLKKLYITGGILNSLEDAQGKTWWGVAVLRVRFLIHLQDDWESIRIWFPDLICVEKSKCMLSSWPCDEEGYWQKDIGKSSDEEAESEVEEDSEAEVEGEVRKKNGSEVEESSNAEVEDEARKSNGSEVEESNNAEDESESEEGSNTEVEGVEGERSESEVKKGSNSSDDSENGRN
ncbi:hypothetical protein ZIOFF_072125 [Zingiber officinale]|uniref:Disease resistance R13L4/SHOC-2-like LRR domain-containing protein n=1 Tax=Zingiber officinale TaxID=94328 RepID=A0A8J5EBZ6_ZINOF|nr:hypothetical protein ZIOFF_072125 [Zingiber officinale]